MTREAHAFLAGRLLAGRFLAGRTGPLRLVIFDCDGVLIDSESLCDRVTAASLTKLGWAISAEECHRRFIGLSFYDMVPRAAQAAGMACLGFSPDNDGAVLRAAGAVPFRPMHAIPSLPRAAP